MTDHSSPPVNSSVRKYTLFASWNVAYSFKMNGWLNSSRTWSRVKTFRFVAGRRQGLRLCVGCLTIDCVRTPLVEKSLRRKFVESSYFSSVAGTARGYRCCAVQARWGRAKHC